MFSSSTGSGSGSNWGGFFHWPTFDLFESSNTPFHATKNDYQANLGAVDVVETVSDYVIVCDCPGMKSSDIKVDLKGNDLLTICGERKEDFRRLAMRDEQGQGQRRPVEQRETGQYEEYQQGVQGEQSRGQGLDQRYEQKEGEAQLGGTRGGYQHEEKKLGPGHTQKQGEVNVGGKHADYQREEKKEPGRTQKQGEVNVGGTHADYQREEKKEPGRTQKQGEVNIGGTHAEYQREEKKEPGLTQKQGEVNVGGKHADYQREEKKEPGRTQKQGEVNVGGKHADYQHEEKKEPGLTQKQGEANLGRTHAEYQSEEKKEPGLTQKQGEVNIGGTHAEYTTEHQKGSKRSQGLRGSGQQQDEQAPEHHETGIKIGGTRIGAFYDKGQGESQSGQQTKQETEQRSGQQDEQRDEGQVQKHEAGIKIGGIRIGGFIEKDQAEQTQSEQIRAQGMRGGGLRGQEEGDVKLGQGFGSEEVSSEVDREVKTHRNERSYGRFKRSFRLPLDADVTKIKACCYDGVLKIILPKKASTAETRGTKIDVSDK